MNLLEDTKQNLSKMDKETCLDWGGEWDESGAVPHRVDLDGDFDNPTVVRSGEDALSAFEKYGCWLDYVIENHDEQCDNAVFIPCGSEKPIGTSSIHKQKLQALSNSGLTDIADVYIMSEPCVVVPHHWRLYLPPVNYDFPPQYTSKEEYPEVFQRFVGGLQRFLEEKEYSTVFSYLVKGHQNKMDEVINKTDTRQVKIPGASYNPDTGNYSGDYFKSTEHMTLKVASTLELNGFDSEKDVSPDIMNFYEERLDK